ncbi:MAG TPA: hypothetical protein VL992_18730, partial [Tepidisphaeraceae bacterium]|nr:hypothetical protein [Tepidisphaeraceae bacterium]
IPEVQALGQCLIGQDREEFVQKLRHAIQSPGARRQISESMRPHSWEARLEEVTRHILKIGAE